MRLLTDLNLGIIILREDNMSRIKGMIWREISDPQRISLRKIMAQDLLRGEVL